jgi:hypothetical protein
LIEVTLIMNSDVEEVLAWKCCNLFDQNLEIRVENKGDREISVSGSFVLENEGETKRITNVYPPGGVRVKPRDMASMYSSLDPDEFYRFKWAVFFDGEGAALRFPVNKVQAK